MGDPLEAERLVLETWKKERDDLDAAIRVLERKIAGRGGVAGYTSSGSGGLRPDEFFRMSIPDAIKKYLKIVGKPARSTQDIIEGLKTGGSNAANYTNTYTALSRLAKGRGVVKVGENWGLDEWYPPVAKNEVKTNGATTVGDELDLLKEDCETEEESTSSDQ